MSVRARVLCLIAAALGVACGETRLIGRSCERPGCVSDALELPAPSCGAQFELPAIELESGASVERCRLFTLDRLLAPAGDGRVFVSRVEVASGPHAHDIDLRLAPELPEFDDGDVDCGELGARAVPWLPLMTTQGTREGWDFVAAPLIATREHRLLVNDIYTNLTPDTVRVAVKINVHCAASVPASVSHAFEFSSRERLVVNPGVRGTVSASCVFSKDVVVSRLYRRTRLVTRFGVRRLRGSDELWTSGSSWFVELEPALRLAQDDGFHWQCIYENQTDVPFQVGGSSSETCSLLGIYRLPGGGVDDFPEHCTVF